MKEVVVSLVISQGAFQKAVFSMPFPYLREPFLGSAKLVLSSRALGGHRCVTALVISNASADNHRKQNHCIVIWGNHRSFAVCFFSLKSSIFSGPASALEKRRLECKISNSLLCQSCGECKSTSSSQPGTACTASWLPYA